jgi:hypothetical protein
MDSYGGSRLRRHTPFHPEDLVGSTVHELAPGDRFLRLIGSEVCSHFAASGWQGFGRYCNQRVVFLARRATRARSSDGCSSSWGNSSCICGSTSATGPESFR